CHPAFGSVSGGGVASACLTSGIEERAHQVGIAALNSSRRAVFFDRDGVLNQAIVRDGKPYPPQSLAEFRVVKNAAELLRGLKQQGLLLFVVTNQPDIARGTQNLEVLG